MKKSVKHGIALFLILAVVLTLTSWPGAKKAYADDLNWSAFQVTVRTDETVAAGSEVTFQVQIQNTTDRELTPNLYTWYYREKYNSEEYPGESFGTLAGEGLTDNGFDDKTITLAAYAEAELTLSGTIPDTWNEQSEILVVVSASEDGCMGQGAYEVQPDDPGIPDPEESVELFEGETVYFEYGPDTFTLNYTFVPVESGAYDLNMSLPEGDYDVDYCRRTEISSGGTSRNSVYNREYENGVETDYFNFFQGDVLLAGVEYQIILTSTPNVGASGTGWVCLSRNHERIPVEMQVNEPVEMYRNMLGSFVAPDAGNYEIVIDSKEGGTADWNWGSINTSYGANQGDYEMFYPNQQVRTRTLQLNAGELVLISIYYNGSDTELSGTITIVKAEGSEDNGFDVGLESIQCSTGSVNDTCEIWVPFGPECGSIRWMQVSLYKYNEGTGRWDFKDFSLQEDITEEDRNSGGHTFRFVPTQKWSDFTPGQYIIESILVSENNGDAVFDGAYKFYEVLDTMDESGTIRDEYLNAENLQMTFTGAGSSDPEENAEMFARFEYGEDTFTLEYTFVPTESGTYDLDMSVPEGDYNVTWELHTPGYTSNSWRNSVYNRTYENGAEQEYFNCFWGEILLAGVEYRIVLTGEPKVGANGTGWVRISKNKERTPLEIQLNEPVEMYSSLLGSFIAPETGWYEIVIDSKEGGTESWNWGRLSAYYGNHNWIDAEFEPNQLVRTESFELNAQDPVLLDMYYNGSDTVLSGTITIVKSEGQSGEKISLEDAVVTVDDTGLVFNGKEKTPAVTVTLGEETLTEGTDYTVAYDNNKNAGSEAKVIITGTGRYEGTVEKTFTIKKAKQKITATAAKSTIEYGTTTTISVSGYAGSLSYSSSDTTIATVSDTGTITAKKPGTATITVSAKATKNYYSGSAEVAITVKKATQNLTVTVGSKTLNSTATTTIKTTGAKGKVTYSSSDKSTAVVAYNSNKKAYIITAKKAGTVTINVKAAATDYYAAATKKVTIKVNLKVNASPASVEKGQNTYIIVRGSRGAVSYTSSNTKVAVVSKASEKYLMNGTTNMRAIQVVGKPGTTATITVKIAATDYYPETIKKIKITAAKAPQPFSALANANSIAVNQKTQIETAGNVGTVSYKSSNTAVATVSKTGVVKGVKAGSAVITVTAKATGTYKEAVRKITILVKDKVTTVKSTEICFPLPKTVKWWCSTYEGHGGNGHAYSSIDIRNKNGVTWDYPVYAVANGVITEIDPSNGQIQIKHTKTKLVTTNGITYNTWYSTYAHMHGIVKEKKEVKAGDIIGYVSSVGNSTGPHLHFSMSSKVGSGSSKKNAISPYYVRGFVDSNGKDTSYLERDMEGTYVKAKLINHKPVKS